jgi:hypothetical protein
MITSLYALSPLVMVYAWQADPLLTYTVQTSGDLQLWETLPLVVSGSDSINEVGIEPQQWPVFVRLRYSLYGDTNDNGLPDTWEWERFGMLDVDPDGDPDLDGISTIDEWSSGSDPLDFYNGELPAIRIASGREWLVTGGEMSAQALALVVTHADGRPWPGAPVVLRSASGNPALLHGGQDAARAQPQMLEWTDALGRLNPGINAIHVLGPQQPGQRESIRIEAGAAAAEFLVTATGTDFGPPPRRLEWIQLADGGLECSWSGEPGQASAFIVQQQDSSGQWLTLAQTAITGLPSPDPATQRYHLTCR